MTYREHLLPHWRMAGFDRLERMPLRLNAGRGALRLVPHPQGTLLERCYRHGGLRRFCLPDYFLRSDRPVEELARHRQAHEGGIATVEPVGWAEQRVHLPGFRRYFYYSVFDADATPLPTVLAGLGQRRLSAQMAAILHRLFRLGIHHHDLNLNNWLVAGERLLLIDFDRARLVDWDAAGFLGRALARIARSGKKLGFVARKRGFLRLAVLAAALFDLDARSVLRSLPVNLARVSVLDRLRWRLSGGHQSLRP